MKFNKWSKIFAWNLLLFSITIIIAVIVGILINKLEIIWTALMMSLSMILIKLLTAKWQLLFISKITENPNKKIVILVSTLFFILNNVLIVLPFLIVTIVVYGMGLNIFNIFMALANVLVYSIVLNIIYQNCLFKTKLPKQSKEVSNG